MYLLKVTLFVAAIPFTLATDCTVADSTPLPFGDSGAGSPSSTTDPCAQFANDPTQYVACQGPALTGQCNSVGGDACSDSSGSSGSSGDLIANPGDNLIDSGDSSDSGDGGLISRLRIRATLSCTGSEACFQFTNGTLLCLDSVTSRWIPSMGRAFCSALFQWRRVLIKALR